jgi:predicted GNAT family acetyltransferase
MLALSNLPVAKALHPAMSSPIQHNAEDRQFTVTVAGERSLLQYLLKDGVMRIVHTEVPPDLAGHGIAADLVRTALDTARSNGWRVITACSYAKAFLEKHPEYADLLV